MEYTRREFIKKATISSIGLGCLSADLLAQSKYVVRKGDTLSRIARKFDVTIAELKRINGLNGDLIKIGQTLYLPEFVAPESSNLLLDAKNVTKKINVRRANWKIIVAHHSAIKYGNATVYDRAHRKRGMQNGLAYHFVIGNGIDSGDGQIEVGPRWKKQLQGGHVRNHKTNLSGIGICMIGNFEETRPSQRQMLAFVQLLDWLQNDVLQKKVKFAGHKDIERNLCPGKNFPLVAMHRRYD